MSPPGVRVSLVSRISLSRLPGERVLVVDDGAEHEVATSGLPDFVRAREADERGRPRWV